MAVLVWELIWLMLPGFLANMTPPIAKLLFPNWSVPLSAKLFGKNKTWRGLVLGILVAILVSFGQSKLYPLWSIYNYANWYSWGFLLGLGALGGDVIESYFKRKMKIEPGKSWIPFDQVDHIIGALVLGSVLFFPGWLNAIYLVIITLAGHLIINWAAFKLKIRTTAL